MSKIKTITLALIVSLTSLTVNGQSVKDFFIPASPKNKATFYSPDENGGRTSMARAIYYSNKGSSYDILDAKMFNGNPGSIVTRTVTFTNNEAKMTQSVSTGMMETNKKRIHNPPVVLLKMPVKGENVKWEVTKISGDIAKYTATWTTVSVNGKSLKAIKVEETVVDGFGTLIKYYVQGIGLWNTDFKGSDGKIKDFEKFDQLEYDPTAK